MGCGFTQALQKSPNQGERMEPTALLLGHAHERCSSGNLLLGSHGAWQKQSSRLLHYSQTPRHSQAMPSFVPAAPSAPT